MRNYKCTAETSSCPLSYLSHSQLMVRQRQTPLLPFRKAALESQLRQREHSVLLWSRLIASCSHSSPGEEHSCNGG